MRLNNFGLLLFLALFSVACTKKLIPSKPVLVKNTFQPDSLPLSEIDIPIAINLKPLYMASEKNVPVVYTSPGWPKDYIIENCDTRYMYHFRRGPFRIAASGNNIQLLFTGYYQVKGSQRGCAGSGSSATAITPWTPPCSCGFSEGERKVEIGFKANIALLPDYTVRTNITRSKPAPIDRCTVCFFNKDITQTVMDALVIQLDESKKSMQDSINRLSLRPRFQMIWDQLNAGMNLYDAGFLQINPQQLRVSNMMARNDTLYLSVGLSARPIIRLEKPAPVTSPVPNISDTKVRNGFNIFIDAQLNYDSLSNLLTRRLQNTKFDIDKSVVKKQVILDKVAIYGADNDRLILKIDFSGSDRGTLYLTGKPVLNAVTNTLDIEDIDYDLRTKDMLLRTAKWLFDKRIINELKKYTHFELAEYLKTFRNKINEQLTRQLSTGIYSNGSVNRLQVMGIYALGTHLLVRCNAGGRMNILVANISL
jgi:Domain of unknown function (DUF4403)